MIFDEEGQIETAVLLYCVTTILTYWEIPPKVDVMPDVYIVMLLHACFGSFEDSRDTRHCLYPP